MNVLRYKTCKNKVSTLEQQLQDHGVKQKKLETQLQDLQLKVDGIRDLALKNSQHLVLSAAESVEKKRPDGSQIHLLQIR